MSSTGRAAAELDVTRGSRATTGHADRLVGIAHEHTLTVLDNNETLLGRVLELAGLRHERRPPSPGWCRWASPDPAVSRAGHSERMDELARLDVVVLSKPFAPGALVAAIANLGIGSPVTWATARRGRRRQNGAWPIVHLPETP